MAHGDAREGKWRGNWRMEWVASTLHTTSEHGVFSITTADAHTSAASSRLNWRPRRFKLTRPFCRKTKTLSILLQLPWLLCIHYVTASRGLWIGTAFCFWNRIERWESRDSIVDIANWLGDGRSEVRNPAVEICFTLSPKRPDWLWGSPSHLFSGYRRCIPVMLTASLLLAPRSRKKWGCNSAPLLCLDGVDRDNFHYKEGPTVHIPYILQSNPHPFCSFRGLKNQMRIRIARGLDSRSRAGFWRNDRAAVRAVRTIQYLF
jgi:hypothetical protein